MKTMAGWKKLMNADVTSGLKVLVKFRKTNVQCIPKRALGNLFPAAKNRSLRNLSKARNAPRDTAK